MADVPLVVLHIPHASRHVPPDVRPTLLLSDQELDAELLRMTDAYTDELFDLPSARVARVLHPVSRLVVDPERFRDDADEPMAARGMGAVYVRTAQGEALREGIDPAARERLLAEWYDPHHARLATAVDRALAAHGRCLLVDCHSFPSTPLPCDLDQRRPRPEICIGTDPFHTPKPLVDALVAAFEHEGFEVAVDRPYAGALVPARWYGRDARVAAVMVELSRALYMDEATGERLDRFGEISRTVERVLRKVSGLH